MGVSQMVDERRNAECLFGQCGGGAGPHGRIAVSNVEALGRLSWEPEDLQAINTAWSEVQEVPEMPGSYYISRSIDHSFWNVVNNHENPRNILLKHGREVDNEIARKWKQYENR